MVQTLPDDSRGRLGAWLFLSSLAVFFISTMILYVVYVAMRIIPAQASDALKPTAFYLPRSFIASTFLLIGISWSLNEAVKAVRRERQMNLRRFMALSLVMSLVFLLFQFEGMWLLVSGHNQADNPGNSMYGLTFILALLHALHVVGGVVAIVWVIVKTWLLRYDHERYWGVEFCAWYWHFLDGVWVLMLIAFAVTAAWVSSLN